MNKDKLSYYASYVAIICGIFLLVMKFYTHDNSSTNLVMALLFVAIGFIGLRKYKKN
jgi:membrane-bound ClpP family serine protease